MKSDFTRTYSELLKSFFHSQDIQTSVFPLKSTSWKSERYLKCWSIYFFLDFFYQKKKDKRIQHLSS